jgi:hypothetical protein
MTKKEKEKKKGMDPEKQKIIRRMVLAFYILILAFSFFRVYHDTFDKKINLGGDNAGYYILGSALATGQGYTNIHTLAKTPHNHFPPGYPAIIAATIKIFSGDILFIKKVNGFFFFMGLVFLFLIIRKITGNDHIPFITVLFLIYNFHLLYYSMIMMSEIPFFFFTTLLIWMFMTTDLRRPAYKNWSFLLLTLILAFTYLLRSTALSLFLAFLVWLSWKRKWEYAGILSGGFILLNIPWFIRSSRLGGNPYIHAMMYKNPYRPEMGHMGFGDWFERIWQNIERYITREIPSGSFDFVQVNNYKDPLTTHEWVFGIFTVMMILWGLYRLKKYRELIFFYLLFSFGILLLWPPVWTGIRFVLPFIPLLFFLFVYGLVEVILLAYNRFFRGVSPEPVLIVLAVTALFSVRAYAKPAIRTLEVRAKRPYPKKYKNYFEIALWSAKHTPDTSVICCRKGQLFYLFSHRYVTGYKNTLNKEEQIEFLKKRSTDYVVLDQLGFSSTGRYLFPAIKRYPNKFKTIKKVKDPDTYLLEFRPQLGYWGGWKDDKKNGDGTFVWPDGRKFIGRMKDDKKNGPGILYFPNGFRLEGTWINDKLEGPAILKDGKGDTLELLEYKKDKVVRSKVIKPLPQNKTLKK